MDAHAARAMDMADYRPGEAAERIAANAKAGLAPSHWPEPMPLEGELPPVLPFMADMLPDALHGWVRDIAERMNVPADLVGIPAMVAAGSLIGRRCGIRPQRHTDWQEAGNIWGCVVAPPGAKKSPAAGEALAPLQALEREAAEDNAAALQDQKLAEKLHKLAGEEAEKRARAAIKSGGDGRAELAGLAEPGAPAERRHLTSDATAEKLGEICAANPLGVMLHRDELLSMFSDLDREDRASARGFFLSGWGGKEGYTFDRIGRGTVRIPAVNLSVFGTTQPHRLAGYIRDSLKGFNDGMVQRLQLLAWPDFNGDYAECDRAPLSEPRQRASRFYQELARLDTAELGAEWEADAGPSSFPFLRFAADAQPLFSQWLEELERKLHGGELSEPLQAHFAKFRGLIPRLALICHIASEATGPVSKAALVMALRWDIYLQSHARRAYGAVSLDSATAARAIWRKVQKGDLADPFTARDIQRKGWSGLTTRDRVAAGLAALCEADWLAGEAVETGGRPSMAYQPNPRARTL